MESHKTVQDFIDHHGNRREELVLLRDILLDTELVECVKWGGPCYTINNKNVIGIGAFKSYVGLWFHQGVFLKDKHKVLINAQEGTTKALRQWRFKNITDIDADLVRNYVQEAIENQKAGKEIKAVKAKNIAVPIELKQELESDKELASAFHKLTPGKQREYSEHIGIAKQEKTRLSRLEKSIPLIVKGVGLNDKYKK